MIIQRRAFLAVLIVSVLESVSLSAAYSRARMIEKANRELERERAALAALPENVLAAQKAAELQRIEEFSKLYSRAQGLSALELAAPTPEAAADIEERISVLERTVFHACWHGVERQSLLFEEWKREFCLGGSEALHRVIVFNRLKYRYMNVSPEIFMRIFPAFMEEESSGESLTEAQRMHKAFVGFIKEIQKAFYEIIARKKTGVSAACDSRWHELGRTINNLALVTRQHFSDAAAAPELNPDARSRLFLAQPIDSWDEVILRPLKSALKRRVADARPVISVVDVGRSHGGAAAVAAGLSPATLTDGPVLVVMAASGSPQSPALPAGSAGSSSLPLSSSPSASPMSVKRDVSLHSRRAAAAPDIEAEELAIVHELSGYSAADVGSSGFALRDGREFVSDDTPHPGAVSDLGAAEECGGGSSGRRTLRRTHGHDVASQRGGGAAVSESTLSDSALSLSSLPVRARRATSLRSPRTCAGSPATVDKSICAFDLAEVSAALSGCGLPAPATAATVPEWPCTLSGLECDVVAAGGSECDRVEVEGLMYTVVADELAPTGYFSGLDLLVSSCTGDGISIAAAHDSTNKFCQACGDVAEHSCDWCREAYFCPLCFDIVVEAHKMNCTRKP